MIKKYYIKWEKDVLVVICNLGKYVHSVENILVLDVEKVEVERNNQPTIYATIAENQFPTGKILINHQVGLHIK